MALGYLRTDWLTLDPTYGRGNWWKTFRPEQLVTHDAQLDGVDFRQLPHADNTFDCAVFDPPYICIGGRKTTNLGDFHDRYGILETPRTAQGLQDLMNAGLTEVYRVVRPGAFVLMKCQDYVTGGGLWPGTHHSTTHALSLGFKLFDRLEHVSKNPRPQPKGRDGVPYTRQVHARRNL
ncbi:MAG TPA: hypothetical protein VII76_11375, partial [Acidimicrobiales bacterium]